MTRNISVTISGKCDLPYQHTTESTIKGNENRSLNISLGRNLCTTDILFIMIFKRVLTFKVKTLKLNLKHIIEQFIWKLLYLFLSRKYKVHYIFTSDF